MILIIDNYDSFSYNLYQMIGETGTDLKVIRNDEMTVEEIRQLMPECIILSPGPGRPEDAGVLIDVIKTMGKRTPILGVCLGHQAICAAYGSKPRTAPVARYHSLIADKDTLAHCLKITALTEKGEVMAVQHKEYPVYGVQFHPESIMTPNGKQILGNFIKEACL